MKNLGFRALFAVLLMSLSAVVQAQDSAVLQFSTLNDYNAPDNQNVEGARLAFIHGRTGNVSGIDFSIGLSEVNNLKGISLPLYFGANRVRGEMKGVSFGLLNWHEGNDSGANVGMLNFVNNVEGLNLGFVNVSSGETMIDVSAVNISEKSRFQLAFFNKTDKLEGIQIGFLNCAENGFFPCFPIFNFGEK